MAASGDWITPRLDGQPWFTASGTLLHLPGEWYVGDIGNLRAHKLVLH
jgi:hypothetical protein